MAGPPVRTDIVDVYIYRRAAAGTRADVHFLQMRRCRGALAGTWHPVMGHIEEGETAAEAAARELAEETGWDCRAPAPGKAVRGFWQLEAVNTYFLHRLNCIMMSPCFAVEVAGDAEPQRDDSHDAHRWIPREAAAMRFIWPGQRTAVATILRDVVSESSTVAAHLSIDTLPCPGKERDPHG